MLVIVVKTLLSQPLQKTPQGQCQQTFYANARSTSPAPPPPANSACPWIRWGECIAGSSY